MNKAKANLLYSQFNFNKILNLKDTDVMYDTRESSLFQDHISLLDIQLPEYETIEEVAMKYSYSIRIAYDNIDKSEKELAVARHKVIPDITVIGGYAFQEMECCMVVMREVIWIYLFFIHTDQK